MRTQAFFVGAVCIALAAMVVGMSGVGAVFGTGEQPTISSSDTLNDTVEGKKPSADGGVSGSNDGELVQFITNGLTSIADIFAFGLTLPTQLRQLGLPDYWATPIGRGVQLFIFLGFAFLAMNRRLK